MRKWLPIAAFGLALSGCSVSRDKASAETEVAHFHQLLDAGRFHDIYAAAEPEFRATGSEQMAFGVFQMIHDRLGAFRSSHESGWRVNFQPGGNMVHLTYNTQFASAVGAEDFVFRIRGGAARLVGYHVNSPALVGAGPSAGTAGTAGAKPSDGAPPAQPVVIPAEPPKPSATAPADGK